MPPWHWSTRSSSRCWSSPAPATSWPGGSTAPSDASGPPPTSRSTGCCGGWRRTAGSPPRRSPRTAKPDKKVYSAAGPGRAALAGWLREPVEPETVRHELAVKIRAAAFDDPAALLSEVERHRESHAALLARYLHGEQRDFPDPAALDARQQLQHVVLRGGIEYERMTLAWLDDVLATLHRLAADRTGA